LLVRLRSERDSILAADLNTARKNRRSIEILKDDAKIWSGNKMQKMAWKFGELEKVATDEGFIWYAELKSESSSEVPFCLVSADTADVDDEGSYSRSASPETSIGT